VHLKVSYEDRPDNIAVVRVAGDGQGGVLDAASAPALRSALLEVITGGRIVLVVDLSAVVDIHKAGLRVLLGGLKRVQIHGGTLTLVVTSQHIREILADTRMNANTRLDKAFRIHDTVASAVAELAADYAETSVEQRRAALVERAGGNVIAGGYSYEHVSEHVTVVTLVGELDVYIAPDLRKFLVDLVNHGRVFLALDMTEVDYIESTGLGLLVGCLKRVRNDNGSLALVVPQESVRKIFRINGLVKVLPIFDTVDPAVEFLGREVLGAHA